MNTTHKMNKVILSAAIMAAITGTAMAAGVNNTVDSNATLYGAESYGKSNTITAGGTSAFAVGYNNTITKDNSFVYGNANKVNGTNSIAGGEYSKAVGRNSVAIGSSAEALKDNTFAIGSQARAAADNTVAIGNGSYATNTNALAIGVTTTADGKDAIAVGSHVQSNAEHTVAIGTAVTAKSNDSIGIGHGVVTNRENSIALGNGVVNNLSNSIGIGNGVATNFNTVGIGNGVTTNVQDSIAVGNGVTSDGESSVAIGNGINAGGVKTVNIGTNVSATGVSSIVVGRDTTVNGDDTTIVGANNGTVSAGQSVVVGYNNSIIGADPEQIIVGSNSKTNGQGAIAVGTHAEATAVDAMAIGNNTVADQANSVAIGTNSTTDAVVSTDHIHINGERYEFAGGTADSTISVGATNKAGAGGVANYKRTITNVAAGRIDGTSTDAVNGSQLNAVINALKFTTVADGKNTTVAETTNIDGGKEFSVNVNKDLYDMNSANFGATAEPVRSVVNKEKAHFFNDNTSTNAKVDASGISLENTDTLDTASYTMNGMTADSNGKRVEFTTNNITVGNQQIHDVKAGTADTDAANVKQLNDLRKDVEDFAEAQNGINTAVESTLANHKTAINNAMAEAKKHSTVVAGDNIVVTTSTNANGGVEYKVAGKKDVDLTSASFGSVSDPVHNTITKDGMGVFNGDIDTQYKANGVVIENRDNLDSATHDINGVVADSNNRHVAFTTNGIDAGKQVITNVAAGTNDTDAVNVSQLNKVNNALNGVKQNVAANTADIRAIEHTVGDHEGRITANESAIKGLENKLVDTARDTLNRANSYTDSQVARVGAQSAALAGLHPLDFNKNDKASYAASFGHYRNANALAVGAFYRPNERTMLSTAVSFGQHPQVNVGIAFKTGKGSEYINEAKSKDSRIAKLEALVDKLTAEVAELKAGK